MGYKIQDYSEPHPAYGRQRVAVVTTDVENVTQVSIESEGDGIPSAYKLHQNYPNPFNSVTRIRFAVSERERVTLEVFDFLGKRVANLVDQWVDPGEFSVAFDGTGWRAAFTCIECGQALFMPWSS